MRTGPKVSPDPRAVAQIAARLEGLPRDAPPAEQVAAVRGDIQTHGLAAFFHAVQQRLAEQRMPPSGANAPVVPSPAAVPVLPADGVEGRERQTWMNCIGSRMSQPLRVFQPTTLDELRAILRRAAAEGFRVKAVGSGHSFSEVAVARDFLIDTHGLGRPLPVERELLRHAVDAETLFQTEAGIRLHDLNEALWEAGLGLTNMGGYDGQTIAGVISTSTHGSGLAFGPLSSQVESLTIVADGGKTYRVEPAGGITDPARWSARHPDIELKQDDDWFDACQVGLGCLGVVYSVVLRVRERYYLKEERQLSVWSRVKRDLQDGQVLRDNRHYEVLVNPYPTKGEDYTCLITRRNLASAPAEPLFERPHRNFLVDLAASLPGTSEILHAVLNVYPYLTPQILDSAMAALARDYVDRSYDVFNIGAANDVPAYGSEIGFTMHQYLPATERILEIAARRQEAGQAYLTSPFALRFVKAANAHLSMMHGGDTCMIEFPMLKDTVGGVELLQEIETEMYRFGGRPHWGLLNFLTGANNLIAAMYPMLPTWLAVYRQISPNGRFENAFTERCGISERAFGRR